MRAHEVTPYPEINAVLEQLLHRVQTVLGARFTGLYLYGSLASGGFEPRRSDIDFVVVADGELPLSLVSRLEGMHARLAATGLPWAQKLEGAYLPAAALRRYDPDHPPRPTLNDGRFYRDRQASDWVIQRYTLREHGVVVAGPPPVTLIDPVQADDLRRAVQAVLEGWWTTRLEDPARLATPGYPSYTVLTMCRALHTLAHGTVATKTQAAVRAQAALEERWRPVIARALAWPDGNPEVSLEAACELIRYTLERSRSARGDEGQQPAVGIIGDKW